MPDSVVPLVGMFFAFFGPMTVIKFGVRVFRDSAR